MARLRRLNEALKENAHAPIEERWIVSPVVVVLLVCALIAFVAAGQPLGIAISAAAATYFSWDGWRRYRRSTG
jgi:hypothetical protein